METKIKLNSYDMITAAQTGLLRVIESDKRNENWGAGYKESLNKKISDSISGAMAEIAVANCLDIIYQFHCYSWELQNELNDLGKLNTFFWLEFF